MGADGLAGIGGKCRRSIRIECGEVGERGWGGPDVMGTWGGFGWVRVLEDDGRGIDLRVLALPSSAVSLHFRFSIGGLLRGLGGLPGNERSCQADSYELAQWLWLHPLLRPPAL